VAEIAPGILQAAKIWFPGLNRRVLEQPNVHVFLEDGRNELLLNQERYDLITMELSSVWFAGVSSLYSRDFYALAKGRLRPGGVLQQWIQIHHLRPEVLISTVRTLRSVFPFVSFWVYGGQGILVASEAPQLLQPGAMAQAGRLMEDWQKGKAQATELQTLLKSRLLTTKDVDRMYREFPTTINTDRNCYLEYASPKENLSKLPYQDINIKRLKAFANQP